MNQSTVEQRLRALARIARHPVCPVRLQGSTERIVLSFRAFVRYREEVEGTGPSALANDFKAIKTLGRFLGIGSEVWPRKPYIPRKARTILPKPEDVRALLNHAYTPDVKRSYENALVKALLRLTFTVGLRFPSEAHALQVQDFDPERHTLLVTEPKKGYRTRRLLLEPTWICCSKSLPSLMQYLRWRRKVDVGGTDAFFLKPNGEPFPSAVAMKAWLERRVKPHFPWWHGYLGRVWSVNARLVEWSFDYPRVAEWHGHEKVDMTRRTYEQDSRLHAAMYGGDWLARGLGRSPRCTG